MMINDKNNYIDELTQKIKDINFEVNKIFDIVCDESEISVYKSSLLTAKLDALQILLKETFEELQKERKRLFNLGFKIHSLELLLDVFTLFLFFANSSLGLWLLAINFFASIKIYKIFNKSIDDTKRCDEAIKSTHEFDVLFENCYRLVKGHTKENIESSLDEVNSKELRCIELANEHIEIGLVSGVVDNIPDDIRSAMVRMLQDDLESSETDLMKLLNMANEKVNDDTMKLSRRKNDDFSKN